MKRLFFILVIANCLCEAYSQEIHLSQFYAAPLYLAPSYAGTADGLRIVSNYRDQWPQISHAFISYMFSADYNFSQFNSGGGIMLARDQKGELGYNTTNLGLYYSYDIFIAHKVHVRPGLQFVYSLNGIDLSKLKMRDQIVNKTQTSNTIPVFQNYNYPDAGVSLLAYTNEYYLGFKSDHLFRPAQLPGDIARIPLKFDIFGGAKYRFGGKHVKLKSEYLLFAFDFRSAADFSQLDLGLMGVIKSFQMGLWYRGIPAVKANSGSDALILSMGYIFKNVVVGFSHDFTISGLSGNSNGANEASLIILFGQMQGKKNRNAVKCPEFY